ncbi:isopentenyl-diphosphate Delta-isomerase [Streptomyces sp. NPDC046161]|uniref:isopentenyl-diphosphate Delta-isomerase n=1 Tax=Streptomyces sp. NPDC046161 TaxID=3155132 RepID=UPI0033C2946D
MPEQRGMVDEMIVLLDEDWEMAGVAPKVASHHERTPLHLAFSCYVFDGRGQLLLTRRSLAKKTWPGVWTNSCCGHPGPGEPLEEAVARRLTAELGASVERMDTVVSAGRYRAVMGNGIVENEVGPVVRVTLDGPVVPEPSEIAEVAWVPWPEAVVRAASEDSDLSPWSRLTIAQLADLGPDPWQWPVCPPSSLPPSLRPAAVKPTLA